VFEFKLGFLVFGLGGVIQAAVGLSGGSGAFLTKRIARQSGWESVLPQGEMFPNAC